MFSLFQTLYFLTLELSYLPIYRIAFSEKIGLCFVETIKCCISSILCDIPLVRGDYVDIPLSEEVIVGVMALCFIHQV